jgi:hypothetical protein
MITLGMYRNSSCNNNDIKYFGNHGRISIHASPKTIQIRHTQAITFYHNDGTCANTCMTYGNNSGYDNGCYIIG